MWGLLKFIVAIVAFVYFCIQKGIEPNSMEAVIGIAILLGGFIAHKDG